MEKTDDMKAILNFLNEVGVATIQEISFCTEIAEWRVEIDLEDMRDEGWVMISVDNESNSVAWVKSTN